MWGETERSPPLAAPGFNNFGNVGNRSTGTINGKPPKKKQALSEAQFELVQNYLPLAYSLTKPYHGRGVSHEELRAGAEDGLFGAALNFDPGRGYPFAAYARPCIKGGIKALFKKGKIDKLTTLVDTIDDTQEAPTEPPAIDLGSLDAREQRIVVGRAVGETLKEVGKELGVSTERARQIEARATEKLRTSKGNVARACIRDLIRRRGYKKPYRATLPFRAVKHPCRAYTAEEIAADIKGRKDLLASAESRIDQAWWDAHKQSCVYWMGRTASQYRFKNDGPPKFQRWPR
jgi:RNA polymerase sigma factor (sigma-70 family)